LAEGEEAPLCCCPVVGLSGRFIKLAYWYMKLLEFRVEAGEAGILRGIWTVRGERGDKGDKGDRSAEK
jgi:hypothetical protein